MKNLNINYDFKIIKTLEDFKVASREIAIWKSAMDSVEQATRVVKPPRSITIKDLYYNRERFLPWGRSAGGYTGLLIRTLGSTALSLNIHLGDFFRCGGYVPNAYLSDFNGARLSLFVDSVRKENHYSGESRLSRFSSSVVDGIVEILGSQSIHIIDDINFLANKKQ